MATDTSEAPAGATEGGPLTAFFDIATVLYGLAATGGTLALLNGLDSYAAYTNGVPDPIFHLLGTVGTLLVGFVLLVIALAGTVAKGVESAS
jgi:hypothetical protein